MRRVLLSLLLFSCSDEEASSPIAPIAAVGPEPPSSPDLPDASAAAPSAPDASEVDMRNDRTSDAASPVNPAGPAPTQTCTAAPDADKIFKLTSAKSDYWVRLPPNYNTAAPSPVAMVVAIHGCGDTARNFILWGAVPPQMRASQDYIAISVGGREGQCWNLGADEPLVTAAIDHVRKCYYAHQKRITLMGYSSGGLLAYQMGLKDATKYAGLLIEHSAIPNRALIGSAAWKLNVAHTGGKLDTNFPPSSYNADWAALRAAGFPLRTQELNVNHDGTSEEWQQFLLPKIKEPSWVSP